MQNRSGHHHPERFHYAARVKRNMHYDLNGNMRSFERYNGDEILKYKYLLDGNQLVNLKSYPGTKDSAGKVAFGVQEADNPFEYDAMGNLVYDGQNQLKISYDFLNLPQKIAPAELHSQAGELFLANYCYLWNGEKVASTDVQGSGYLYIGSARYELAGIKPAFDSAPFAMGRIQAGENGNAAQYFLNDHLGSVRPRRSCYRRIRLPALWHAAQKQFFGNVGR